MIYSIAPFRLPLGVSPLVVLQKVPHTVTKTPVGHAPLTGQVNVLTPKRTAVGDTRDVQDMEVQEAENQDISSPVAARARVNAVTGDYGAIRTPATAMSMRKASIPLQRAVLLSTGESIYVCTSCSHL